MNIETANRLLQYRKQHNLSQEDLAAKIGVSRQAISKWERAEASPDTDNLILLADIYDVTLDELLKGEIPSREEVSDNKVHETEPNDSEKYKYNYSYSYGSDGESQAEYEKYEKTDKVSFKNGIHVDSRNGDHVHINLKDGVHIHDKNGDKVDVGWNGIHVEENGVHKVYTDENGDVYVSKKVKKSKSKAHKIWNSFPFFLIAIIGFLAWGFSGVYFGWTLSWICFLTIPIYYTLGDAIFKKKASHFCYPVLVVIAYILFGYFNICGGWAFGWIAFLTIPIYYFLCELFESIKAHNDEKEEPANNEA